MSETLLHRYQLRQQLSQSADAQTYRALDTQTQASVVIKCLELGKINAWKRLQLFEREARVLAALNHPRIPRLLDFYREQTPEGLTVYLVSSWIEGQSLADRIEQNGLPDESTVLDLAEQLLRILEYLHAFQPPVIHRDIKPSNLIISPTGQLYLIDFGGAQELLRPMGGGGSTVIGTFGYMAPEQFAGRAVPASDLYGMGTSLIHLLSGRAPIDIPQRNLQLSFQGLVQGSGGLLRWLTRLIRPGIEDRFASASMALQQLYAMTGLSPSAPLPTEAAPALSESLRLLLTRPDNDEEQSGTEYLLAIGDCIEGYQISAQLSQGTYSASYLALAPVSQQEVFLKVLHFQSQQVWKGLDLFEREIAALQALNHPGIPKYIDNFKTEQQDFYLVTEKIEGQNLEQKLLSGWRPLESEVIELALQALDILQYLHTQKPVIVHRDLKPSNFLIDPSGQLYLIDFGGVQNHFQMQGTGGSTVIGTYGYIAPEEFLKKAVPATDLYSLGVTLVRLLSGYEPTALPQHDLRLSFRSLLNCSEALKDWLETMTEPDLQQRFRTAIQARSILDSELHTQLAQRGSLATYKSSQPPVQAKIQAADLQVEDHYYTNLLLREERLTLDLKRDLKQNLFADFKSTVDKVQTESGATGWRTTVNPSRTTLSVPALRYTPAEAKALQAFLQTHSIAPKGFGLRLRLDALISLYSLKKSVSTFLNLGGILFVLVTLSFLLVIMNGASMREKVEFPLLLTLYFLVAFLPIAYLYLKSLLKRNQVLWHHHLNLRFKTSGRSEVGIYNAYESTCFITANQAAEFECQKVHLGTKAVYLLIIKQKIRNSLQIKNDLLPFESFQEAQAMAQLLQMAQDTLYP